MKESAPRGKEWWGGRFALYCTISPLIMLLSHKATSFPCPFPKCSHGALSESDPMESLLSATSLATCLCSLEVGFPFVIHFKKPLCFDHGRLHKQLGACSMSTFFHSCNKTSVTDHCIIEHDRPAVFFKQWASLTWAMANLYL